MSVFEKLSKAIIGLAIETPIAIIKDVATMGGACTETYEPYTATAVKKVIKNIETLTDDEEI